MMNITYTLPLPDDKAEGFILAFARQHGFNPQQHPMTPLEFGRLILNQFVRESVVAYMSLQAAEQAKVEAMNVLNSQLEWINSTISTN